MTRDVDQRLTALPECPTLRQKLEEPPSPVTSGTLPQLFVVTVTTFPEQWADVSIYAIVLAAMGAAVITGVLRFYG